MIQYIYQISWSCFYWVVKKEDKKKEAQKTEDQETAAQKKTGPKKTKNRPGEIKEYHCFQFAQVVIITNDGSGRLKSRTLHLHEKQIKALLRSGVQNRTSDIRLKEIADAVKHQRREKGIEQQEEAAG